MRGAARESHRQLVILQGSDCNSVTQVRASQRYAVRALPAADVLAAGKYGIDAGLPFSDDVDRADCPAAHLRHDSPAQHAADLAAVIAAEPRQQAYRQVVALGGSEGAVVAHLLPSHPMPSWPGLPASIRPAGATSPARCIPHWTTACAGAMKSRTWPTSWTTWRRACGRWARALRREPRRSRLRAAGSVHAPRA